MLEAHAQSGTIQSLSSEDIQTLRNTAALKSVDKVLQSEVQVRLLVKQAQAFSPLLRELEYAVDAAEQDINVAKGARMPRLVVSGASRAVSGDLPAANRANGKPYLNLNAELTVYDFGRIDATVKNREARKDAGNALLYAVEDYSQTVQKLVDMLTKVVEADPGRGAELVQARSRLLQSQQSKETERSGVETFRIRLNRLIGADKSSMCDGIGASFLEKPDIEKIRAAVGEHPQVRAFKFDLDAANRQMDEVSASRKPQVQASAAHAPILPGLNNDYIQTITLTASMPIFDGNILKSSQQAALERARAAAERVDLTVMQLDTDYRERYQATNDNLRRVDEFTSLIEINDRVRKDFFVQWYSLGRRSLFELLAIEQEQYNLQRGYFTSLFDAMINIANIEGNAGLLSPVEARSSTTGAN
jgi:adhesin transport system outer membrane protein